MRREAHHLSDEELALLATEEPDPAAAAHLQACAHCRTRWQQYQAISSALRSLPRPQLGRDLRFAPQAVAALARVPWWWRHRAAIRVGTVLAAAVLALLLTSTVGLLPAGRSADGRVPTEKRPPTVVSPTAEASAPIGAGGESLPAVQAFVASPEPTETVESSSTVVPAGPAATLAPSGEERGSVLGPVARIALYSAIALLAVLTLAGLVLGFLLPLRRSPPSSRWLA